MCTATRECNEKYHVKRAERCIHMNVNREVKLHVQRVEVTHVESQYTVVAREDSVKVLYTFRSSMCQASIK